MQSLSAYSHIANMGLTKRGHMGNARLEWGDHEDMRLAQGRASLGAAQRTLSLAKSLGEFFFWSYWNALFKFTLEPSSRIGARE